MEEDGNHDNQLEADVKEEAIEPEKPDVYVAMVADVYMHAMVTCVHVCCHGSSDCVSYAQAGGSCVCGGLGDSAGSPALH